MTTGIVCGSAATVWNDLANLPKYARHAPRMLINDAIYVVPWGQYAFSNHIDWLENYLDRRQLYKFDEVEVHAVSKPKRDQAEHMFVDKWWRIGPYGFYSSAMAGAWIMWRLGYRLIIFCGCPMGGDHIDGHVSEFQPWADEIGKSRMLEKRKLVGAEIRSMSGWTREQFGTPEEAEG